MQDKMKCHICSNYLQGIERCKFCSFEYDDSLPWTNDVDWDIFELDDEVEWSHLQIMYRLKAKGIECLYTDIWADDNLAIIIGAKASSDDISRALGVDKASVYDAGELPLIVVNLFQEKVMRTCPHWREVFEDG